MSLVQVLFQHSPTNRHSRAHVHLTDAGTFLVYLFLAHTKFD